MDTPGSSTNQRSQFPEFWSHVPDRHSLITSTTVWCLSADAEAPAESFSRRVQPPCVKTYDFFLRDFKRATKPATHLSIIFLFTHSPFLPSFPPPRIMCFQTIPVVSQPRSNITCRRQRNPANLRPISTSSTAHPSFSEVLLNCQSAANKADFLSSFSLQSNQLDLIYTCNCTADNILVEPLYISNHFFITFLLHFATCMPPTPLPVTFRRNLRPLSPSHLSSVVSSSLPSPTHFSYLDVNAATDTLCSTLTSCLDNICPLSSRTAQAAPSNSWLSNFLCEHRTKLRAAERKWCKSKYSSDLSKYQSLLSSFSAKVHTDKSSYFHNKINSAPDTLNLFRTFNSLLCPPPPPLQNI